MNELTQYLEILATVTGIVCVYLQTKENILAWPFGLVSVSILVYVFNQKLLYSDVILHILYIGLNLYGWWYWSQDSAKKKLPIQSITTTQFMSWWIIIGIGALIWGWAMNNLTDADLVYFDAFTTVGSLSAQFLLARKVIQNWIIWIIVDIVAINMYIYKELYFVALMFTLFLVLCIKGYRDWKRSETNSKKFNKTC